MNKIELIQALKDSNSLSKIEAEKGRIIHMFKQVGFGDIIAAAKFIRHPLLKDLSAKSTDE